MAQLTKHLWQCTLFAAISAILCIALRKNRSQVRFSLWFCVSCKFLLPFALLTSLGSHLQWRPTTQNILTPAVSVTVAEISGPLAVTARARTPRAAVDWTLLAFGAVWASGLAAVALMRLRGWRQLRAAIRASTPGPSPSRAIEVRFSTSLLEPGVVGVFRPILLLPHAIAERLTPPQLTAVLAHEMCHIRRRDNLRAAIHMIVEAVFWFHPLVWWVGAKLVEERERACDEEVLRQGSEPRAYAEAILNVCKL